MKVKEKISTIKENIEMAVITSPELLAATREEHELRKSFHPGFVISFDNLDFQLKNMTKDNQNQDCHWVNHQMVKNLVSGNSLHVRKTDPEDIVNIPNTKVSSQFVRAAESTFGLHNFDIKNFSLIL